MNVNNKNSSKRKMNNNICQYKKIENILRLKQQNNTFKNNINKTNKYQSDIKEKESFSPYFKLNSETISKENQKILLQKRELEIKALKIKCRKLEQENHKYQLQNILLKENCKSQNINDSNNDNSINKIITNNTSSNFPIRNEIKKLWENFAKIDILNNFIEFENEPEIIYHLVCELILLSNKMIKEHCLLKYQEIIKIMGIKNNSCIIKDIETQFKTFMKEHLNEIFNYLQDKSFINNYKKQYKEIVLESIKCMSQNDIKIFEEILEQYEFNDMLKSINDIIIFTQFNDPILFFSVESNYENRKMKYLNINNDNKKNYIIVNDLGNSNINNNSLILLEPPCMKSGHTFFNELKPIIILIEIENQKDIINLEDSKKEINLSKERQIIDEPNKFNYLNKTNKINKILNLYMINDNNKMNDKNCFKLYSNNVNIANNCFTNSFKNFNYDMIGLCDDSSFEEDNKKYITSINSSSRTEDKKFKKINITEEINSDEHGFNSTTDNLEINKLKSKPTMISNHFAKVYNKIHRIKSANNYFDKNIKQLRKDNNKFIKKKKDLIKKEVLNKIYNKYKQYIISKNNFRFKKKLIEPNNVFDNQSLSIKKTFQKPLTSKHYINFQNKQFNKNYNSSSSIKANLINMDYSKRKNQINSQYQNNLNNQFLKICKTNINIRGNKNFYKDSFLKLNRKNEIISTSKAKENIANEVEQNLKRNNKKNIKNKFQNIKINYRNYHNKRNIANINTSTKAKQKSKRIDSYEQKNSFLYSTLEDIKKMMNDTHKSIIMISTNSYINNNTININNNKKSKKKYKKFNKERNKDFIKKYNYNTINNSIKQLISLPNHKAYENDYINYNSIEYNDYNKNSFNQNYNNKDLYYKYFSTDESKYNKLNISNNFKIKSNSKSKNKNYNHYQIPKDKEANILYNNRNKSKINNINNLSYINKNRIKDIQINIDCLNNNEKIKYNFNTIGAKKNEFKFQKICH